MKKILSILAILLLVILGACSSSENVASNDVSALDQTSAVENAVADEQPVAEATEEDVVNDPTSEPVVATSTPGPSATSLPASFMDYPVVPNISQRAMEIYQQGVAEGNDPHAFSKIGDCQNITTYFLAPFEDPNLYSLGDEYAYLQGAIDYFYGSFSRESLAVAGGLNVARVLSPLHADPDLCEPNEHPLACEIRINNPSIAIVSLEENWGSRTPEEYEKYYRQVIDYLISENVLPIMATKADNLEGDNSINEVIAMLAGEYQLPLWNFWRAAQPLPNHGLEEDGFHLTIAGPYLDDAAHMQAGWPWRNLTALQSLNAVMEAVSDS
ncbi:hypothetical protein KQH54_02745 [bacterium]|nr:hypothetical protein [bacterium]